MGDLIMESAASEKIDYAEETIINSESFDAEYFAAIESARSRAKQDKAAILDKIKEEYLDVFGVDATNEIILEAFQPFVSSAEEEEEENKDEEAGDYDDEDFEEYEEEEQVNPSEMESALNNVRRLAKQHQSKFVEDILSTFNS